MSEPEYKFVDLPEDAFPFQIEFYKKDDPDEVIYTTTVTEPGSLQIPGLADTHGPIGVRVLYPGGVVDDSSDR